MTSMPFHSNMIVREKEEKLTNHPTLIMNAIISYLTANIISWLYYISL